MLTIELNHFQGLAIAALVYTLGSFLIRKVPLLSKYCIPAPVVGGLIYALAHLALRSAGVLEISFDTTLQDFFMTIFFTSVGFTASFRLLKRGSKPVIIFLCIAIVMVVLQNILGVGLATVLGLDDSRLGLCMGSIPMVGGHGTAGSMGDTLDQLGVVGAKTVAIASATYGLLAGSMLGGPLARRRIAQRNLHSTAQDLEAVGTLPDVEGVGVDTQHTALTSTQKFTAAAIFLGGCRRRHTDLLLPESIYDLPLLYWRHVGCGHSAQYLGRHHRLHAP